MYGIQEGAITFFTFPPKGKFGVGRIANLPAPKPFFSMNLFSMDINELFKRLAIVCLAQVNGVDFVRFQCAFVGHLRRRRLPVVAVRWVRSW